MATIASLLRERVTLQVNSVDRIFLAGYIPKLQSEGMLVRFLLDRGMTIPSPAVFGKIGAAYVRAIERFAKRNGIPVVHFKQGESKEQVARRYMQQAQREGRFGVVMIGVAQERCPVWRGYRAGGPDWHPHFSYRRMSACPNHYYFYRAARRPVVSPAQPGGTRRESLGLMADRDPKGERDNRMPEKRRSGPGAGTEVSAGPA